MVLFSLIDFVEVVSPADPDGPVIEATLELEMNPGSRTLPAAESESFLPLSRTYTVNVLVSSSHLAPSPDFESNLKSKYSPVAVSFFRYFGPVVLSGKTHEMETIFP